MGIINSHTKRKQQLQSESSTQQHPLQTNIKPPQANRPPLVTLTDDSYSSFNKNIQELSITLQIPFSEETKPHAKRLTEDIEANITELVIQQSSDHLFVSTIPSIEVLGNTLAFLMLNRPATLSVFIHISEIKKEGSKDAPHVIQFVPDKRDTEGVQGYPFDVVSMSEVLKRIRVFHVHAHFDEDSATIAQLQNRVHSQ
jgi:aromatic ring-cleaving dioxygenase